MDGTMILLLLVFISPKEKMEIIGLIIILILEDRKKKDLQRQQQEFLQNRTCEERNLIYDYTAIKGHIRNKKQKDE